MSDLKAFLLARLVEDERDARDIHDEPADRYMDGDCVCDYPARVLAEVAAKRAIVERYERAQRSRRDHQDDLASAGAFLALHGVVKLLAQLNADHDDYDEAWRL